MIASCLGVHKTAASFVFFFFGRRNVSLRPKLRGEGRTAALRETDAHSDLVIPKTLKAPGPRYGQGKRATAVGLNIDDKNKPKRSKIDMPTRSRWDG